MYVSPLIQSLQRLDARKDRGAFVFYLVIFLIFAFLYFLPFSASVQKIAMRKSHLTLEPFSRWAVFQFVPAMYNFENEFFWSLEPLSENFGPTSLQTV